MNKFAFIIHPIDVRADASRKYPAMRFLPVRAIESLIQKMSPSLVSHITGIQSITGAQAEGWLVACPLSPRQMVELPTEFVYEKILKAARIGAAQGAKIVGLGAFTSVAGDAGVTIAKRLEGEINVTTGNSYTIYTAVEGLLQAAQMMEIDVAKSQAVVIGATGSIGAVCAKMLANQVAGVSLVGRNREKLESLRAEIKSTAAGSSTPAEITVADNIPTALREADLVLTVSSSTDVLIYPADLKSGAIVCDAARPRDVSRQVAEERDDVLVIEGGVIEVPGEVEFNFDFGFPTKTAYACMSETMLLALEGTYEPYTLGRELSVERVENIGKIARKHGFKLSGFRSFERAIGAQEIERVRQNARRSSSASLC